MSSGSAQPRLRAMLDDIAGAPPGFGGGAVAAGSLALAAGLLTRAARASVETWQEAGAIAAQAAALQARASRLAEDNLVAYAHAREALRPPAGAVRGANDLGPALALAAAVPLRIGGTAADTAQLAALIAHDGDPDYLPDTICAACLAEAAALAAQVLVDANLGVTPEDPRAADARAAFARATAARQAAQRAGAG